MIEAQQTLARQSTIAGFEWQKACFLFPYMLPDEIEAILGVKMPEVPWNNNGSYSALVLVNRDSLIPIRMR